jgi:hypothetical protein
VTNDGTKRTDDVAGPATHPQGPPRDGTENEPGDTDDEGEEAPALVPESLDVDNALAGQGPDLALAGQAPPNVAELSAACIRFVATRYGVHLDFMPDTLSVLDQWVRDAREELRERPEAVDLVESSAGAYLGEVVRRAFGAFWITEGDYRSWRLALATVFCAFNPVGMVREALMLAEAEGWHAHFELDPGEKEVIAARLEALPEVREDEFYAPSTRFDVVNLVVDALRERMRASGLGDVRFTAEDYAGI